VLDRIDHPIQRLFLENRYDRYHHQCALIEGRRANIASGQRIALQLALSNQQVANRIGSVRDVVSRALARLKHDGLIATKGRTLIIPDVRALKLYAASVGRAVPPVHTGSL
jgi:CRP-like cAMP-binding protein